MTYKEILDRLEEIEGQLDDSFYSLPEWDGNSDGRSYLDGARSDLYGLKDDIERKILDEQKDHDILYNIEKKWKKPWLLQIFFVRSSNK